MTFQNSHKLLEFLHDIFLRISVRVKEKKRDFKQIPVTAIYLKKKEKTKKAHSYHLDKFLLLSFITVLRP